MVPPIIAHSNPYLDHVIDDPMFGKLFYEESDLAQAILEAIDEMPAIDETKWAEKIDEIFLQQPLAVGSTNFTWIKSSLKTFQMI